MQSGNTRKHVRNIRRKQTLFRQRLIQCHICPYHRNENYHGGMKGHDKRKDWKE